MSTLLTRPIRRRAVGSFQRKPYTVALLPGDLLEFREWRRRKRFVIELSTVLAVTVARTVAAEKAAKRAQRQGRRSSTR